LKISSFSYHWFGHSLVSRKRPQRAHLTGFPVRG
jgi:hypothetical protein